MLGLLLAPGLAQGAGRSAPPATTAEARLTPVVATVLSTPRWFRGDDRRFHLQYELQLTNAVGVAVDVSSVQVRAPGGRRVATLSGTRLQAAMSLLSTTGTPTRTLPAATVGVVWMNLAFKSRRAIPARIEHRLTIDVGSGTPGVGPLITHTGAPATVTRRDPVVLAPPVRGGRWTPVVGVHTRSLLPVNGRLRDGQRFAVDFSARLDRLGRTHDGPVDMNDSYANFRQPVLAVGAGRVVTVIDGFPDQVPLHNVPTTLAGADGNHVIIRLRRGVYAGYAHLVPGSVRVHEGQRIRAGQVLGRLGNSGNSSGPHLHFQLMNRPSLLDADGLPFVVDGFRYHGRIPSLDALIAADAAPSAPPVPYVRSDAGPRRLEGLTGLEVVTFR